MDIALIVNPRSGASTDAAAVTAALRSHGAKVTAFPLDAEGLRAAAATTAPVARVVVAGGDGSVAPAAEVARALQVPLAVVPSGTGNDLARHQGIPLELRRACALAVRGERLRRLDLGRLSSGSCFVNVAQTGLSSAAVHRATPLKPRLGPLAYAVGAVRAAARAHPLFCEICVDGEQVFAEDAWQVIVGVTGAFGGGMEMGAADPHDGLLDVAVLPAGARLGLVRRGWGIVTGTLCRQAGVVHRRGRVVELELPPGTGLDVDGEVVRAGRPERLTVEPAAFELVIG